MRFIFLLFPPLLSLAQAPTPDNLVLIPGGSFQMGNNDPEASPAERPVHTVTLSSFYLGKYEVTVAAFKKFVDDTDYKTDAEVAGWSYVWTGRTWENTIAINWRDDEKGTPRPFKEYNHPVLHISWEDAAEYCLWMRKKTGKMYRLPTEAEWEYAAGGGDPSKAARTKWAGTSTEDSLYRYANIAEEGGMKKDKFDFTAPVGSFLPNNLGLYDMNGNAWEWCSDWHDGTYPSAPQTNPGGPAKGQYRTLRGGSWVSHATVGGLVSLRYFNIPKYRNGNFGFRVAVSAK